MRAPTFSFCVRVAPVEELETYFSDHAASPSAALKKYSHHVHNEESNAFFFFFLLGKVKIFEANLICFIYFLKLLGP